MQLLNLTHKDALKYYPEHVAQALKSMSSKFRRAKQVAPAPDEFEWSLQWGAGIPGARPPLKEVSASLYCRYERRMTCIRFPDAGASNNGNHLPHHVLAYYAGSVDPSRFPDAPTFRIRNPNGSVDAAIATGGYAWQDTVAVHYLIVGEPWLEGMDEETLIEIRGNRAVFEGGLRDLARERYDAAGEGNVFTFGSKTMKRLTPDEIRPHVQGKTFNWSLF